MICFYTQSACAIVSWKPLKELWNLHSPYFRESS